MTQIAVDPFPADDELNALWRDAWGADRVQSFAKMLAHGLGHVGAYDDKRLIGFVNVAWDGGIHAFILDTCVLPEYRRQGIALQMLEKAVVLARDRGAQWLHVDFEPQLEDFYRKAGFGPTAAGLMRLA